MRPALARRIRDGTLQPAWRRLRGSLSYEPAHRQAKYIYTIPTEQNSTATVMSERRRAEIIRLSSEYGVPVFEDDTLIRSHSYVRERWRRSAPSHRWLSLLKPPPVKAGLYLSPPPFQGEGRGGDGLNGLRHSNRARGGDGSNEPATSNRQGLGGARHERAVCSRWQSESAPSPSRPSP